MTGGGDLDGDVVRHILAKIFTDCSPNSQYNIASLGTLPLRRTYEAAAYTEAPKKLLDRKCTMDDVAEFVTDYINSDVSMWSYGIVPFAEYYFYRFWALLR